RTYRRAAAAWKGCDREFGGGPSSAEQLNSPRIQSVDTGLRSEELLRSEDMAGPCDGSGLVLGNADVVGVDSVAASSAAPMGERRVCAAGMGRVSSEPTTSTKALVAIPHRAPSMSSGGGWITVNHTDTASPARTPLMAPERFARRQ